MRTVEVVAIMVDLVEVAVMVEAAVEAAESETASDPDHCLFACARALKLSVGPRSPMPRHHLGGSQRNAWRQDVSQ